MDFRQLEMLLSVAENESFTLAGRQLHVSQSAISRKIKLLEDELGIELFKRVNKRVYVTSAGETLVRCARRVFQDISHTSMEISELAQLRGGHVRIASGMTACIFLLPPVLEKFKAKYPQLEIVTGPKESLLNQVLDNSIDLGVFTLPIESPALEVIPFCDDEMVVVTSAKNSEFSKRRPFELPS
jgi:DNA-binding transcriptional LysR family regulator